MGKISRGKQADIGWAIVSLAVGASVCIVLLVVTTLLVLSERVGEVSAEILIAGILMTSSFAANLIAGRMHGVPMAAVPAISTALILLMLVTGCFLEGPFQRVWFSMGAIIGGGISAYMICLKSSKMQHKRKRRYG